MLTNTKIKSLPFENKLDVLTTLLLISSIGLVVFPPRFGAFKPLVLGVFIFYMINYTSNTSQFNNYSLQNDVANIEMDTENLSTQIDDLNDRLSDLEE